jgi:autotransporter adhesin
MGNIGTDFPLRGNNVVGREAPVASGSDSVAAGYGASAAGDNAAAYGSGASAGAENAVAIGNSANAGHANSVAIGTNARTTRANQVALGTAGSTYTMGGVTSAASRAAQSGSTQFVTTDTSGNLATSSYGPNHIAALDGRVGNLETSVSQLQRDIRGAYQGTAIALALTGAVLPAGKNFAVSTNFGTYRGETGFGASGVARITDNVFVSGGIGLGTSGQTNIAGRGGVTLAW